MDRCIATSCDANYFPALMALLRSLHSTNPSIPVVVFDGGLSTWQKKQLPEYVDIRKAKPFMELEGRGKFSYIGLTTLLKLEAAALEYEKVLYIDVDSIVLEDLTCLFSIPEGKVGVVPEVTAVKNMFRKKDREQLMENIPMDWEKPGFNAGVFVLCPEEWKDLKSKARALVDRFSPDVFSKTKDQQLLNIIFSGKTYEFSRRYNFSPFYDEASKVNPAIIHYLTKLKPWHYDYPKGHRYREFRQFSSFMDYPGIFITDILQKWPNRI